LINRTGANDFILVAQKIRLIGERVIWIKPSWPNQPFHFKIGSYKGFIASQKGVPSVCFKNHHVIDPITEENLHDKSIPELVGEKGICGDDVQDEITNRWDVTQFNLYNDSKPILGDFLDKNAQYILDIDGNFRSHLLIIVQRIFLLQTNLLFLRY
jgi:hypothetical protein